MATRTKKATEADNTTKIDIPSAVRPAAPAAKPNAASLLAGLAGKAKPAAPKAAAKKDRPELALSPETEAVFAEYAPAKELLDVITSKVDSLKGELNASLFDSWVENMWANKTVPTNPAIRARSASGQIDAEAMFIVQEKFKLQIPDNDDPAGSVAKLLVELGVQSKEADELTTEEVDFTPQLGLRPFGELVTGTYVDRNLVAATAEEQAVGQKLLEFVTSQLTAEEQALVLRNTPKTVIKKGFLARIAKYAHSKEQLASILKVFIPVAYPKGAKFAVSDTPVAKTSRLVAKMQEFLGSAPASDEDDDE